MQDGRYRRNGSEVTEVRKSPPRQLLLKSEEDVLIQVLWWFFSEVKSRGWQSMMENAFGAWTFWVGDAAGAAMRIMIGQNM